VPRGIRRRATAVAVGDNRRDRRRRRAVGLPKVEGVQPLEAAAEVEVAFRGCPARSWWKRLPAGGELDGGTDKVVGQVMGGDDDGALGPEETAGGE
jgi:hypothetical protein